MTTVLKECVLCHRHSNVVGLGLAEGGHHTCTDSHSCQKSWANTTLDDDVFICAGCRYPLPSQGRGGLVCPDPATCAAVQLAAEEACMNRDRAIEHAINALAPAAGAYDLPGHVESGTRAAYGDAICSLAFQLGDYIKNGA